MSEKNAEYKKLRELLSCGDSEGLLEHISELQPADIADALESIDDKKERITVFNLLDDEVRSEVIILLERDIEVELLNAIPDNELADIVEEMAPDDAADFLSEIEDKSKLKTLLENINDEERKEILHLLSFGEETAGGIMTSEFLPFPSTMRVDTVIKMIRSMEDLKDPIMYVYAVEPVTKIFIGAVSLVDLIKSKQESRLIDLVDHDYVWASVDADQEEIAKEFRRYNLWVMPVLDDQHRLVGRITADDILDVSIDEADEDLAQMTGTPDILDENVTPLNIIKLRLPWLMITLCLALINSIVIESMLEKAGNIVALAVFLPVIMAMGGNTGMQSATVIIREMALDRVRPGGLFNAARRESLIGLVMGILCGLAGGLVAFIFMQINDVAISSLSIERLSFIVFLSIANAMTFSSFFGSAIPQILFKAGFDPAVAAGPFVTTLNDIISSVIYFLTAYALIAWVI